jgi:hypothetical protein
MGTEWQQILILRAKDFSKSELKLHLLGNVFAKTLEPGCILSCSMSIATPNLQILKKFCICVRTQMNDQH